MNGQGVIPVVTIDGPVGSGKGTIARRVADALGWHLLDSGALYRLVALAADRRDVALDDVEALVELARQLDVRFGSDAQGEEQIWLDCEDVTRAIRTEECGAGASAVAALGVDEYGIDGQGVDLPFPPVALLAAREVGGVVALEHDALGLSLAGG